MKHPHKKVIIRAMMYVSHSPEETQRFAKEQALELIHIGNGQPIVIALEGELGAGKTTFAQAFAEALGVQEHLKSPTFVLMKHYRIKPTTDNQQPTTLYHLDCYRLKDYKDLEPLGVENILNNPENIVLIEWAERVADILPKNHWVVHIDHIAEQERNITVNLKSKK
ncbi:MAG: tRNA (adenosine(37)-N6)-threonylcarbamoyltransferase complex ATPase subunit type 1 TsaE [Patescibacteria group bacterium]